MEKGSKEMRLCQTKVALIQHDCALRPVLIKGGNLNTDTQTGEHRVEEKAEIGVMLLQAREHQGLPANYQKQGERQGTES